MPQTQASLRHHYIPVFYLKRWLLGGKKIVEFSRPYGNEVKPRRTHPSGTGFVDRLYEMRGVPPELAQQVEENIFRPVDTRAADVMESMHLGIGPRDARDRLAWTQFLVSMLIRNPEELQRFKAVYAANFLQSDKKYERIYAAQRRKNDPQTFADYLAATPHTYIEANAMKAFVGSLAAKHTTDHIFRMKWGHLEIPFTSRALMTSDRPIISEGLIKEDGHLLLPIGPKRVFYAVNRHSTATKLLMTDPDYLVNRINTIVTVHAHKYVYATTDSVLPFVKKHMSLDPAGLITRGGDQRKALKKITKADLARGERLLRED